MHDVSAHDDERESNPRQEFIVRREVGHQEQWVYLDDPHLTAWDWRTGNPDILERLLYFDGGKLVAIHE